MAITVKLDELMAKKGLNSNELAEKIGVSAPSMSLLKAGKARAIKFSTLDKLCQVLECEPCDILIYTEK